MDPLDPLDAARKRSGHPWVDVVVGGSAILIALISLVIALRQSQIMDRQLAASVWPHLQYGTSNQSDDGKQVVSLDVENAGVGPALVHSMSLHYRGRALHNARELVDACCKDLVESGVKPSWSTSTLHDWVLTPSRQKSFFVLTSAQTNAPYWQRLNVERENIQVSICYCSVLGQCWLLDSRSTDQQAVAACPAAAADDYRE
jgi:hypothetical protein